MSIIKVDINKDKNIISVYNNGKGIPVVIHKEHNIYVPELIFGHLLTSSNYDDSIRKITGGRNGYGAKLTNIFSKKFTIETLDTKNKKKYVQVFSKNMSIKSAPEITTISNDNGEKDYTKITFEPDLSKFKMKELEDDIVTLMKKRVYDLAGTSPAHISVHLNGKKIPIKNFKDYIEVYFKEGELFDEKIEYPKIFENPHNRWEVMVTMADSQFQQVSFVNGICTSKGGTHVNHVTDQIVEKIAQHISKKQKDLKLKPNQIKQNLWVFVNCFIENPTFDSQTKETMTLKESAFGSKCELTEKFLNNVIKSPIIQNIVENAKAKEKVKLHKVLSSNIKKSSRLLGINKLEDANNAGTKNFENCTLIITEGDSAKALAMSGIEVIGRDSFGVYPLKGKFLNVRDANHTLIINNKEIQDLIKILGLQMGRDYTESLKGLRYGNLMIMADQDYDGSHIKGLIINFIHNFWPSLIKRNDFLKEFITPIVKVSKNDNSKSICFYTLKEYRDWYESNKSGTGWKIKYYKGLGTSTSNEAKEYFKNIVKNRISFKFRDNQDDEAIDLAFSKVKAEARKEWLTKLDLQNTYIDHSKGEIRYKEFIDKELILFSNADNFRSIPNIMDGLKPSERKILYACFKRNLKNELKVAQLAGYVAEHSLYHHGEQSLCSTITSMAQDFVGSNNVNLLMPIGQFGNRYNGSKGAASPRYIYTSLNKLTRSIFREEDDNLLTFIVEEGQKIEPIFYSPIIPMLLVNGAEGIGTGWSTTIPQYNPIELAENILKKLNGEEYAQIKPWYRGFKGEIVDNAKNGYSISGVINVFQDDNYVEISELPVQKWTTRDYKTFLEENLADNKETANKEREFEVEDIKEYHTENNVFFRIKLTEESYKKVSNISKDDLLRIFKLTTQISNSNMVVFDPNNKIKKYSNVNEIIDEFYNVRLDYYSKRREYMLSKLKYQLELNSNKNNFIKMMLSGTVSFLNMSKYEVCNNLRERGFLSNSEMKKKYKNAFKINSTDIIVENPNENLDEETKEIVTSHSLSDFDYIMSMNIWSLTKDKVTELEGLIKNLKEQVAFLEANDEKSLWTSDLEEFINEFKVRKDI